MNAGLIIKEYLILNGIKQIFVSLKTNIPKTNLNMMLNGKIKISADNLVLIAEAIDFDLNLLKTKKETTD